MPTYRIERMRAEQAAIAARMVAALLAELSAGASRATATALLPTAQIRLADVENYHAFVASDADGAPAGIITLARNTAIYAAGAFGTIQELYVAPAHRSGGVGALLLAAVLAVGRQAGWSRIEVGAPSAERWHRTVAFYKANGFVEIGPRLQHTLR
jgi:GNAT superfamily N-acetyltransferase